jgi:hypothetical protein
VSGLRALGATAQLDIERLRRMVIVGSNALDNTADSVSPSFSAFLVALNLFINSFNSAGGFRLLRIARPAILTYGLYGIAGLGDADQRLLRLLIDRNLLANQLDCLAQCGCDRQTVLYQVVLDKILYDIDRAIDLYAVGIDDFGEPENRAIAYAMVVQAFLDFASIGAPPAIGRNYLDTNFSSLLIVPTLDRIRGQLDPRQLIPPGVFNVRTDFGTIAHQELCIQLDQEARWQTLVQTLAPDCVPYRSIFALPDENGNVPQPGAVQIVINAAMNLIGLPTSDPCNDVIPIPQDGDTSLQLLAGRFNS